MDIKNSLLISFDDVFDNLDIPKDELLSNFNRDLIMLTGTTLINMSKPNSQFNNYKKLLFEWFSHENIDLRNEIYKKIADKEKTNNISLLNMQSSLQLIDYAIANNFVETSQEVDKSLFEKCLFKFYLLLNKEHIKDEKVKESTNDEDKDENKLCALLLSQLLAYNDIIHYNINDVIVTQFIKSVYLLEFISKESKFIKIYHAFLAQYEIQNWREYLMYYAPLVFAITKKNDDSNYIDHIVEQNENYEISCRFLDKHILNIDEEIPNSDFRYLRSKPFYKVGEGEYRAIYDLFIAEKIYNGLHFVLSGINSSLPDSEQIKSFRGELGYNFSENFLFYSVIERITQLRYKGFSGQFLHEKYKDKLPSEPDYYLRNGKHIFLFENKDVLLKADVKISYDFKQIKEELAKKFYGGKSTAVRQLIGNIKKVLNLEFPFDKDYKVKNVNVYPIIVTHYRMYDTSGINYLVNTWFMDELQKLSIEGLNIENIRPITIINIDTLIIFNDLFRDKKLSLSDLIDKYADLQILNRKKRYKNEEEGHQAILQRFIPFSGFVDEYTRKNKLIPTYTLFKEKGVKLILDK